MQLVIDYFYSDRSMGHRLGKVQFEDAKRCGTETAAKPERRSVPQLSSAGEIFPSSRRDRDGCWPNLAPSRLGWTSGKCMVTIKPVCSNRGSDCFLTV